MNALKTDAELAEYTGTYTLGISHQTKKYMLGSNVRCPETARLLLRKPQTHVAPARQTVPLNLSWLICGPKISAKFLPHPGPERSRQSLGVAPNEVCVPRPKLLRSRMSRKTHSSGFDERHGGVNFLPDLTGSRCARGISPRSRCSARACAP